MARLTDLPPSAPLIISSIIMQLKRGITSLLVLSTAFAQLGPNRSLRGTSQRLQDTGRKVSSTTITATNTTTPLPVALLPPF